VIVHLDIDVFRQDAMPAAYFPHREGLTRSEGLALLRSLLRDPRISVIEVAEYDALRDHDQKSVTALADLLTESLGP